ncbi:vascular endothelial growth factor receptor 1 [Megalopta genalis]|uniref:vascular endothelial growth factor receptor 1 n=1 Tax=Megalopta genalis TaxID=115081 RepID=UPI003FD5687F
MLCNHQRFFFIAVILLSHLYRDSTALKPNIFPKTDQIIQKEHDPLWLQCSGKSDIVFMYPTNSTKFFHTSSIEIRKNQYENGTYMYQLMRPNTVYGDTGWYGCSDHFIEISARNYSDPEVDWVYVYVESKSHWFVEESNFLLRGVRGGNIIVPCRPTSPTAQVKLTKHGRVPEDRFSFDPKFGFTLYNVMPRNEGYYVCHIAPDQRRTYRIDVSAMLTLKVPRIINDTLRHVTKGETLYVNCTTTIRKNVDHVFTWTPPRKSNRITIRDHTENSGSNNKITTELIIKNVTFKDAGVYECKITDFNTEQKSKTNITVYEWIDPYIVLTSQDPNRHYQGHRYKEAQWVVDVDAYPLPELKWLNRNGDEITTGSSTTEESKFSVNVTCCKPILRINNLDFDDMGLYSIQAKTKYETKTLNFTLDVIDQPMVDIKNPSSYYLPNQVAKIECYVETFPVPNITWSYRKCPNFPLCENDTAEHLTNSTEENETMTSMVSTVLTAIEMSGQLTCSACNIVGCGNVSKTVMVSDVAEGFGVISTEDLVVEGDDWVLICAASIYNYSDILEWSSQGGPIEQHDRISIDRGETRFTYRSILKIRNVKMEDSQEYICTGKSTGNISQSTEYRLEVKATRAPIFTDTNLNKENMIVDKKVYLKCFADGMPKPNITWFKDGTQLTSNERYKIYKKDQALEIQYPEESDSGEYMCRVQNRIGKVEARQRVTIKGKGVPVGLIILVAMLAVVVVILVIYFFIKVRRERILRRELMEAGLMHFEKGAVECLNPELTVDDQAELLPYDNKWEFPREKLKLGRQLGSGAFGVVLKGEAQGICRGEAVTTVAVKMVRRTTNVTYVRALSSELKILVHLGKHLNVVNLLGACTKNILKRELLVIVEYCRFGNLHNYLLRHRSSFINQIDPATGKFDLSIGHDLLTRTSSVGSTNSRVKYVNLSFSRSISCNSESDSVQFHPIDSQGISMSPDGPIISNGSTQPGWFSYRGDYKDHNLKPICSQDLLSWAFQVARGMEYLSQRRVLHGDLAARNILLADDNIVKICDFGLGKTLYKEDNYQKKCDGPLPIKWLAIESIRDRVFSTQSDIWSFGIVLWEFFTLAETPYPGMEAEIQYQKLIEGYRLEQPEYATPEVYNLMRQCWKAKPTLRPSFTEVVDSIGNLLEDSVKSHYIQLNAPYLDMNTIQLENGKDDYLTMLSAPDHVQLSSPGQDYVNSPASGAGVNSGYLSMSSRNQNAESGIFSPRPHQERTHFDFPSPMADLEDGIEMTHILKKERGDPCLKSINDPERRTEVARNSQTTKNQLEDPARDLGYCNMPKNLELIDLKKKNDEIAAKTEANSNSTAKIGLAPSIIRTQDNYLNMIQQKSDKKKDLPDGFSNPSYVIMSK